MLVLSSSTPGLDSRFLLFLGLRVEEAILPSESSEGIQLQGKLSEKYYYENVRLSEFFSKLFDLRTIYVIPNDILAKNTLLKPTL